MNKNQLVKTGKFITKLEKRIENLEKKVDNKLKDLDYYLDFVEELKLLMEKYNEL